ncbi:methyl-accepting chemotaxis protein [Caulobacter segnis]|uniref:Chemotaxis protein n=1 Tax=Caulobacter segnis TaxID=88688 RepID=A0A2W5X192_9CAUL|nr:methyl-accepting chemotaxis protein [Caulobacter segnis]PZR34234.1 MAG: chemotaxis protein [Caulobacter segnis]
MSDIQTKIVTWNEHDRALGEVVFQRSGKHLQSALLSAYRVIDPGLKALPDEVWENEKKKFAFIARGNFPPEYFEQQAVITENISSSLDFATYLSKTYAAYAAGLASGLVKEKAWNEKYSDDLMLSLMRSVFSDASVVMFYYFQLLNAKADEERAIVEAERKAVADEQAGVVDTLAESLRRLAQGDLTARITAPFNGRYAQIKDDFNAAIDSLRAAMGAISASTGGLRAGSDEIASASDDLSRRTEQQAASLEETAAALDEITATVKRSAEGAAKASEAASGARVDAVKSGQVMEEAVAAMGEIEQSSKKITNIIGVIDEIAFQTNLLALNAGVEAARAGEAGRGFAVVAQEVRALAQRSADAAKEIKGLIAGSTAEVERGVRLVGDTGKALGGIVTKITDIDSLVSEIAQSSQEQATGLNQVNTAVNQMDQVTQQNAAMVEEATAAASNLKSEAIELERLVARFETGAAQAAPRLEVAVPGRHAPARNPVAVAQARLSVVARPGATNAAAQANWEEL